MLNSAAGRSRKDLSRYPVMPWPKAGYVDKASPFRDFSKVREGVGVGGRPPARNATR